MVIYDIFTDGLGLLVWLLGSLCGPNLFLYTLASLPLVHQYRSCYTHI